MSRQRHEKRTCNNPLHGLSIATRALTAKLARFGLAGVMHRRLNGAETAIRISAAQSPRERVSMRDRVGQSFRSLFRAAARCPVCATTAHQPAGDCGDGAPVRKYPKG